MPADVRFIDFVHARRPLVGGVLLALAVGCVLLAGWCGVRAVGGKPKPPEPKESKEIRLDDLGKPGDRVGEFEPHPYFTGLAGGLVAALGLGAVGAFFLARPPAPDVDERRRQDRVLLLVGGYVAGLAARGAGLVLFGLWFGKLAAWVGGTPESHKDAWMPMLAVLVYLVGAGVTFLAAVPARAEERNSPWVRRAVYAINFGLTTVLLVVGLVLANIAVGLSVKDTLDTAGGEFGTLSEPTRQYLGGLKQSVKVYALTGDGGSPQSRKAQSATLTLLAAMREANPGKVQIQQLSDVTDRAKVQELRNQYKDRGDRIDLQSYGVLVTSDKPDPVFISFDSMLKPADPQRGTPSGFTGQAQVVNALRHLTEAKATAYFTQASGEPRVARPTNPADAVGGRRGERMAAELAKIQCAAKPLEFDPLDPNPTVPDDADVVVVADPLDKLPEQTLAALRKYLLRKRGTAGEGAAKHDVKPGRLVAFLPARNAPDGRGLVESGLEPLLAEFGTLVTDRAVYAAPSNTRGADELLVSLIERRRQTDAKFFVRNPREVAPVAERGGAGQSDPLLVGGIADGRTTWLEPRAWPRADEAFAALLAADRRGEAGYVQSRDPKANKPRFVATLLSRPETGPDGRPVADESGRAGVEPVAAVFGFGTGLADESATSDGELSLQFLGVYAAALRGVAPVSDFEPKPLEEYRPNPKANGHLLVTVPVVGTLIGIVLLGVGMWVVRRK